MPGSSIGICRPPFSCLPDPRTRAGQNSLPAEFPLAGEKIFLAKRLAIRLPSVLYYSGRAKRPVYYYAVVAELADAHGSGPCGLTPVEVRVLSTASRLIESRRFPFGKSAAFFVFPKGMRRSAGVRLISFPANEVKIPERRDRLSIPSGVRIKFAVRTFIMKRQAPRRTAA